MGKEGCWVRQLTTFGIILYYYGSYLENDWESGSELAKSGALHLDPLSEHFDGQATLYKSRTVSLLDLHSYSTRFAR